MTGAPLAPGHRIGDYELVHELGGGAVGETFKARAVAGPRTGQLVCLKVLAQKFRGIRSAERDAAIRHLRHEAKVVSQLDHPNIARLLDSGVAGDLSYLVFELVDGVNLYDVLAHAPLEAPLVIHLGLELSKALACAHERDVLHRDIKPSNILISSAEGDVKLVDFGHAKLNAGAAAQFSQHVGTPRYFAPEQLRGEPLSPAIDVYAAGLILFELLTGSHPFYAADADVFRRNVLQGLLQSSLGARGLPEELVAIVERCIALDSSKRFRDGTALHDALLVAKARCSKEGRRDLGELSVLRAGSAGHDSQAETRLAMIGTIADRVAGIRDDARDVPTRVTADPMDVYGHVTRSVAPAEAAAEAARMVSSESESIMGDLSRIARAAAKHRSSGLESAEPHRSGVRPAVEGSSLRVRPSAQASAPDDRAVDARKPDEPQTTPASRQRGPERATVLKSGQQQWVRSSAIAAACLLLAAIAAAVVLLLPKSESSPPLPLSTRGPAVSAAEGPTPGAEPLRKAPTATAPGQSGKLEAAPTAESPTGGAPAPLVTPPPSFVQQKPERPRPPRAKAADLVSVTIGTIPYGDVIVDGKRVGRAPVVVKLSPGPHRVVGRSQELRRTETIVVSPDMNHAVLDLRNDQASP